MGLGRKNSNYIYISVLYVGLVKKNSTLYLFDTFFQIGVGGDENGTDWVGVGRFLPYMYTLQTSNLWGRGGKTLPTISLIHFSNMGVGGMRMVSIGLVWVWVSWEIFY